MSTFSPHDQIILRELARQAAEIGHLPVQAERIRLWRQHNDLQPCRPMLLVFPEGAWRELLPDAALHCQDPAARKMEWELRARLYQHAHFDCDNVIEPLWCVSKAVRDTGWGLEARRLNAPETLGAWHFDPVLQTAADLKRLRVPEVLYDAHASQTAWELARDVFGSLLTVRQQGVAHVSYHLMRLYTERRGLAEAMLDMYENPGLIHDFMAFVTDGHKQLMRQWQALGLLTLNNNNTYHNSGGTGWTNALPGPTFDGQQVAPRHMWGSAESQELAQVSPEHHAEFALAYEKQLLEPFALTGYGCCEDLTRKLDLIFTHLPNIRRVSISPWANVDACATQLAGRRAIFSWKPNPARLVGAFDEAAIRADVRHTLDVCRAHDCTLEIILKDTHTCEHHPDRFDRWTRIVREEVQAGERLKAKG